MTTLPDHKYVETGFGYLNTHNLEPFFDLYDEDMVNPSLEAMGLPTGKEGFKMFVNSFYEGLENPQCLPQNIVCEGDRAMFRWILKGRHTGTFGGVPATGNQIEISCFTTFRIGPSGKIIEQYDQPDLAAYLQQVGALSAAQA